MPIVNVRHSGSFKKIDHFFDFILRQKQLAALESYAQQGVNALRSTTPTDSGLTASAWYYEIDRTSSVYSITWHNNNLTTSGTPVAILLQYGHGTRNGGYVSGQDFINPAIQPIFDQIADRVWKAVTSA